MAYPPCPHCHTLHLESNICAAKRAAVDYAEEVEIARWQWARDLAKRLLAAERLDRALGLMHRSERSYSPCFRCQGTGKGGWTSGGGRVNCDRCAGTGVEPAS